jgi:hypothetical protein
MVWNLEMEMLAGFSLAQWRQTNKLNIGRHQRALLVVSHSLVYAVVI